METTASALDNVRSKCVAILHAELLPSEYYRGLSQFRWLWEARGNVSGQAAFLVLPCLI